MKYVPRCFFCNLERHLKSDCIQEELSGVKASRARLMNEAESRKKKLTRVNTYSWSRGRKIAIEVTATTVG